MILMTPLLGVYEINKIVTVVPNIPSCISSYLYLFIISAGYVRDDGFRIPLAAQTDADTANNIT